MTRFIGVLSGKGGVGKTTVVTNLSAALAMKFNKKVTVIDCNVTTSHLGMHFGIYFHPLTLNQVLKNEVSIEKAIYNHFTGVQVIPASLNLADLVGVDISMLKDKLGDYFSTEDFVFLDVAPGFGKEALAAISACREALIVTTPDVPAITDVMRGLGVLEELKVKPIGLVLNKVIGKKFELDEKEITKLVDLPILAKIPFDYKIRESLAAKLPLIVYDENSKASIGFFKLASVLTGEVYKPSRISFLQKLAKLFRKLS